MNTHFNIALASRLLSMAGFFLLVLALLAACGSANLPIASPTTVDATSSPSEPPTASPTAVDATSSPVGTGEPTSTPTGVLSATPTPLYQHESRDAFATRVAVNYATHWAGYLQTATVLALTPPGSPTNSPEPWPTPTLEMGIGMCGDPANPYQPQYHSCWRGILNGVLLSIGAGRLGRGSDKGIGILSVSEYEFVVPFSDKTQDYYMPMPEGSVRITSVDGTIVHIVAGMDQTPYTFDLATRQWLFSTPTAAPIAPTSLPTRLVFLAPGKEAGATEIAQTHATHRAGYLQTATVLALTPPGLPTSTPEPWFSPTPVMGGFTCGDPARPHEPSFETCWRGYVNGELISVGTGRLGRDHDPNIGVLLITPWEYPVPGVPQSETYYSPAYRGSIRITSVEGTVVYLIAADHQTTFAFDLATRQWLFSTPTAAPIPTLLLTP